MHKPETTFIGSVHKFLPADKPHREKMNNPYRGGTADYWYSGDLADLWVEYKYLPKLPKRGLVLPDLTGLQRYWLQGRFAEGRKVAVVVGCPDGGVVYLDGAWNTAVTPEQFASAVVSRQHLAAWISATTQREAQCPSFMVYSLRTGRCELSLAF